VIAVAIAFVAQQWMMYNFGAMSDWNSTLRYPKVAFNDVARHLNALSDRGLLDASITATGLERLALFQPNRYAWQCLLYPALLVIGLSMLRFRFSRFPLHPVLFLVIGTYPCCMMWFSFLIGWFAKTLIIKCGGGTVYQRLKPMFVGIIAGEIIFSALIIIIDMAYYGLHNRVTPAIMRILPG